MSSSVLKFNKIFVTAPSIFNFKFGHKNWKLERGEEPSSSFPETKILRNIFRWPIHLCQFGGFLTLQLDEKNQLYFSLFSASSLISLLQFINQIGCFTLLFLLKREFAGLLGQMTDTEVDSNTWFNLVFFFCETVIRIMILFSRKRLQNFHETFNGKLLNLLMDIKIEVWKNNFQIAERSIRVASLSLCTMTALNFMVVMSALIGRSYIQKLSLWPRLWFVVFVACDFSSISVLYGCIMLWLFSYVKCITAALSSMYIEIQALSSTKWLLTNEIKDGSEASNDEETILLKSKQDEVHIGGLMKHFESISELVFQLNHGVMSWILLFWLTSMTGLLLHQCFSIIIFLRVGNVTMLFSMTIIFICTILGIFYVCNVSDEMAAQVTTFF